MITDLKKFYRKIRYGKSIVVISGLPRSGTSMAMKMLEAGGLEMIVDDKRQADEDNPKGYYEDERVMNLANMDDKSWVADARGKGIKVISYLLKELPEDNNYKVVFMRRHLDEVLKSQGKMLDRRGEDSATEDQRMKDLFKSDLWKANYFLKRAPHMEHIELIYSEVLQDPGAAATKINKFLNGSLDAAAMTAVVDPSLYRNRAKS